MSSFIPSTSLRRVAATASAMLAPVVAFAQEAAPAAAATPVPDKADTAFMFLSTLLVLFMLIPGLALFYGGLVRAKNMLSVLMQCTVIGAAMMIVWVVYGYSFAFGGSTSAYFGGFAKLFLAGVTVDSTAATFTDGVVIPEYLFMLFQMTFAAITPALIVGAFAERIKFSPQSSSPFSGRHSSIFQSRIWSGTPTGCSSAWARLILPAAPSSISMPASQASWVHSWWASASAMAGI